MDDYNGENENANFSVKQLKVNLKNTLKQSGVLSTVKAQIRQEFINGLTAKTRINAALSLSMNDRIMYSSVYHLLRNRRMVNSISVFSAESGLDPKLSLISEEDIVRMVKFNGLSNVYKFMQNSAISNQQTADNLPLDSDQKSLLDVMMQFCLSAGGGSKEMSVQTETSGPSAREILDDRIHELRRTYQVSKEVQNLNPNKTIEERMVAFQRDCEKRLARDLEIQVTHVRENELARVRLEEQSRAHEEMENMRKRLEFEYGKRLQAHIEVESDSAKRLVDQEHATQRALYENRQFMQREIDELRSRESAATRRAELESQGIRALEHRLKESLCMIESREADMQRREQAVEEARKGYQETAHREALARVQSELEILSRERSSLMIEKQHFADEVGAQKALVSSALALKAQLKAQSEELVCREEELQAMQRAAQRLQLQREEEDLQIRKMLDQIDPALGSYTRCEQIVALIQQKADLQVQLAGFRDAHLLQQKMQKMEQEMAAVQGELRESRVQLESHAQQAALQKEHLERAVLAERAKVASQVHKLDELRQLLHDKTLTVDSLRRQLEGSSGGGGNNGGSSSNNYHTNSNADSHRLSLHKTNMSQSQQRAHMSVTDQRAVDFLRRNGNYADAERAQGYASTTEPAPTGPATSSSLIDNVIQRLLLEQLQGQTQHTIHPTASGSGSGSGSGNVGAAAAPLPVPIAAPAGSIVVPPPTTDDAALQAQKAQHAAELTQLAHTLQQEQLKAAEMKTQIEQQKLEQERLAWSLQREKLEAQQRMRELKETEEATVRERDREMEREMEAKREREAMREREWEVERKERLAASAAPVYAPPRTSLAAATVPGPVASMPPPATVLVEEHRTEGRDFEDADRDRQNQKAAEERRQAEAEVASKALQAAQVQRQTEQAAALQTEKDATVAAAAAEVVAREQRERLAAQERELERQRREADEWEQKQQQRETERVAATAKTKEEERLREEKERDQEQEQALKKQRLAQQARDDEEQARLLQAQKAQEEAERVQRENKEKEEKEQREAEERRLQDEREQKEREEKEREEKEREEKEREEQELLNNSALIRQEEAARAAREEEERERAEEAARVEAKEQARLKQEEDEKEIMAARQRVLERRRAAADRNNRMTSSLPTSLQAAAANSGETDSTSTSQNQSTLSHLGSAMMPGVSTSLDSFAPGAAGNRNAPNKNLFPSSFQNLQDSDSSSDRMEVGDMSEEQDSSGMF